MESTSEPGRIHMSKVAAQMLAHQAPELRTLIEPRAGGVEVKGKGIMATCWLLETAPESDMVSMNSHQCMVTVLDLE